MPEDGFGLANVADAGGRPECGGGDFLEGDVAMSEVPGRPAPVSAAEAGADVAFLAASSKDGDGEMMRSSADDVPFEKTPLPSR